MACAPPHYSVSRHPDIFYFSLYLSTPTSNYDSISPAKLMKYFQLIIEHRLISVLTIPRQHIQPDACSYRIPPEDLANTGQQQESPILL